MTEGPATRGVKAPAPAVTPRRTRRRLADLVAPLASRPIRTVMWWQALATFAGAVVAQMVAGGGAAFSAALGGGITIASTLAYALMLGLGGKATAGASVVTMLRAEAVKIVVIVLGLWWVLTHVRAVVPLALIATFVVTVLMFSVAFLARGNDRQ